MYSIVYILCIILPINYCFSYIHVYTCIFPTTATITISNHPSSTTTSTILLLLLLSQEEAPVGDDTHMQDFQQQPLHTLSAKTILAISTTDGSPSGSDEERDGFNNIHGESRYSMVAIAYIVNIL